MNQYYTSLLRMLKVELVIKNWSLAKCGFIFTNTSNFMGKVFPRFFRNVKSVKNIPCKNNLPEIEST